MKKIKVGINGFGRIGRLALCSSWHWPEFEFVQINDPAADAETYAHLLKFDSVLDTWQETVIAENGGLIIIEKSIRITTNMAIADTDWSCCDLVIEASGKMKTVAVWQAYLDQSVNRVVV